MKLTLLNTLLLFFLISACGPIHNQTTEFNDSFPKKNVSISSEETSQTENSKFTKNANPENSNNSNNKSENNDSKKESQIANSQKNESNPATTAQTPPIVINKQEPIKGQPPTEEKEISEADRKLLLDQIEVWRTFITNYVKTSAPDIVNGAQDVTEFCPGYNKMSNDNKYHFWSYFFLQVIKYESGFMVTNRFEEPNKDWHLSELSQFSEGLLQLSYSDALVYGMSCQQFNWNIDKTKNGKDATKTIFNPSINMSCGIDIMNLLIQKYHKIQLDSRYAYWATLIPNGHFTKLKEIKEFLTELPICK